MSLLTALLAFVPALAAKRETEAERDLADARHQINELSIHIEALRTDRDEIFAMLRERDRVIASLSANLPLGVQAPPNVPDLRYMQALAPLPPEFIGLQQAAEQLQAQTWSRMQALAQSQMNAPNFCTCVPGRADALVGAYRGRS
jgi:hypothetical protein